MRISVNKVKNLEDSSLISGFEKVIKEALASKDERRIKAANIIQEDVSNLDAFLTLYKRWKVTRGSYVVPTHYLNLAKKVRLYISKDTTTQRIKSIFRKNGQIH